MPDLSAVTNYLPKVKETYTSTLSSTISALAATVPVVQATLYTDGDVVALTVNPGTASQATFTGTKSGNTFINCKWTEGNLAVGHSGGAVIADYDSATHYAMLREAVATHTNQNGTLKTASVQSALNLGAGSLNGWNVLGYVPASVTNNGNRSYTCVFNTVDLTATLTPGFRLQLDRTVTAPTQSTSLNGTTQYYSDTTVAGMTFTDDFVVSAWVKLSSYQNGSIASRYNGTSGWDFLINANGIVILAGYNAGSANIRQVNTHQSVPLNKWVHLTAQLDMSSYPTTSVTTNYIMIDGVDVPVAMNIGGTSPSALIQAGNLEIGGRNGGLQPFSGKIAQVAIYSAKVTQATIKASMNQTLSGSETSLISAYSFNNSINDLNTTNANNLTANGAAVATELDTPFTQTQAGTTTGTRNFGIVTSVSFSTNSTVVIQVPEGDTLPTTGGVSAVSYSTQKAPYGFPADKGKWDITVLVLAGYSVGGGAINTYYVANVPLSAPIGAWNIVGNMLWQFNPTGGGVDVYVGLSPSASSFTDPELEKRHYQNGLTAGSLCIFEAIVSKPVNLSAATLYYPATYSTISVNSVSQLRGAVTTNTNECSKITAECAYV